MEKNSKIFVAGHNGLVGSAIVRKLRNEGYNNLILRSRSELDLRDQRAVRNFFSTEKPEYVFLAAAKVGGIIANAQAPADFTYDNLAIQTNVIDSAYRNGVKKLLFLGSACIYPKITSQPIKEEYLLEGKLEPTNEGYALAKIVGLKLCEYYKQQYGFNAISLMPVNLYGPNDNFDPTKSHVIPGMIRKFYDAKKNGLASVSCWGDGSPTREFLHSDDLADACLFMMNSYNDTQFVNVGSDNEITIKALSEMIKKEIGFEGEIIWDTTYPNGQPLRKLDYTLMDNLGWKSKVSFEEGLRTTVKWFMDHKVINYDIQFGGN
jgi:GDP-L-fucose synthase